MESLFIYGTEGLLNALWDCRLKLASPTEFNDPYEMLPATGDITEFNRALSQSFQRATFGSYYFLCLSESKNNVRMWAQYGGNHTGLMIEFDMDTGSFAELKRTDSYIEVDYSHEERHVPEGGVSKVTHKDIIEMSRRKGSDWAHEREVRMMFTETLFESCPNWSDERIFGGKVTRFLKIDHAWIRSVTIGRRARPDLFHSIRRARLKNKAEWKVYVTKLCHRTFQLRSEEVGV